VADNPQPGTSPSAASAAPETTAASPAQPTTSEATASPSPDSSASASPTARPTVKGAPTAAELAAAVTSYYALVPDRTDRAWSLMTPSYRNRHAGGRQAYERFWGEVRRVSVSGATGDPPDKAQATVTYVYKDGRVVRERTAYGLVNDSGSLKINSTAVLSSSTE
jgi:hypothetical protein